MVRHKTPPPHGTNSGYDWHRRDMNEEPCERCREAHSLHWQLQRLKRGQQINELRRKRGTHAYHRRRAAKLNAETVPFTDEEMFAMWGYACHICGLEVDITIPRLDENGNFNKYALHRDHVVALSRGGAHKVENVRPSHAICNIRKSHSEWTDELQQKLAELATLPQD